MERRGPDGAPLPHDQQAPCSSTAPPQPIIRSDGGTPPPQPGSSPAADGAARAPDLPSTSSSDAMPLSGDAAKLQRAVADAAEAVVDAQIDVGLRIATSAAHEAQGTRDQIERVAKEAAAREETARQERRALTSSQAGGIRRIEEIHSAICKFIQDTHNVRTSSAKTASGYAVRAIASDAHSGDAVRGRERPGCAQNPVTGSGQTEGRYAVQDNPLSSIDPLAESQESAAPRPRAAPSVELRYYKRPPLFEELLQRLATPPLRAVVHGGPGLGKTALSRALDDAASEVRT